MTTAAVLALLCLPFAAHRAPPGPADEHPDPLLQRVVDECAAGFRGDVGVYVRHLPSGRSASLRADELFPTASMVKVPILLALVDRAERGELDWHATVVYHDSLLYPGDDIAGAFRDSATIALSKVAMLMITTSDNTAALWCQRLAGGGTEVNAWLARNGFDATRVNSRTPGREEARNRYGWGQTTPREMAELLVRVREGNAVNRGASEEMYRMLTRIYWNGEALSAIPPWVQAASKQGAVNRSRSEVVLVNAPSGDYVFCVITRNQEDESWRAENEGFVLLRRVSAALWNHFEPGTPWTPTPGAEKWKP